MEERLRSMELWLTPNDVEATVTMSWGDGSPDEAFTFTDSIGVSHQWPRGQWTFTATVDGNTQSQTASVR